MDKEFKKPPIGVIPHSIEYNHRMAELSNAIIRYNGFAIGNISDSELVFKAIAEWAEEIKCLAEMEIKLLKREKNND